MEFSDWFFFGEYFFFIHQKRDLTILSTIYLDECIKNDNLIHSHYNKGSIASSIRPVSPLINDIRQRYSHDQLYNRKDQPLKSQTN